MAETNFGTLLTHQKMVWSRDVLRTARDQSFVMQMARDSANSVFTKITELTPTERGDRAILTLVPDAVEDGAVGDTELNGNEEALNAYDQDVIIDQIGHAHKSQGRMAEQKTVVRFRETARDVLGYWLADRVDQLAFLTLAGVPYTLRTNGALRPVRAAGLNFSELAFAAEVTAPSANRHFRWDAATGTLQPGDTTAVTATDYPSYEMLVLAKAKANEKMLKPIRGEFSDSVYHVFMSPGAVARLKLDPDFKSAVIQGLPRDPQKNMFFSGGIPTIDGLVIHEYRHVFNTLGATTGTATEAGLPGYKWGAAADVDGSRTLLCGAQALAYAEIGDPMWDEEVFRYGRKYGIAVSQILGFKKPVFRSLIDNADEDFSVMAIDHAI